jgi:hypothetical protein
VVARRRHGSGSVLLLQERGRLKVADPVSKHVPGLPASWSAITIDQLQHHTSLKQMLTPGLQNYGYGIVVHDTSAGKEMRHDGGIEGFSTTLSYRLKDKVSVVALSNVEGTMLEPLSINLGTVTGGADVVLPLERKAIALMAAQTALPLYAESPDQLFALAVDAQFVAERDAKGAVQAVTLVQNGQRIRMACVADARPD